MLRKEGQIIPLCYDKLFTSIFNDEKNIDIIENFLSVYFDIDINKLRGHVKLMNRDLGGEKVNLKSLKIF